MFDAAFDPAGRQVITAGGDARLSVWDSVSGRLVRTLAADEAKESPYKGLRQVCVSPDGRRIGARSNFSRIYVWPLRMVACDTDGVASVWEKKV